MTSVALGAREVLRSIVLLSSVFVRFGGLLALDFVVIKCMMSFGCSAGNEGTDANEARLPQGVYIY